MSVRTPTKTTLTVTIDSQQRRIQIGSGSGIAVTGVLVLGAEICPITAIIDATNGIVEVLRGREGTKAKGHLAGIEVDYFGATGGWKYDSVNKKVVATGYAGSYTDPILPTGSEWTDPDTGQVYKMVDTGAAFQVGEWVVVDGAGLAAQLAIGSKGHVGIVVETVESSDRLAWVLIIGTFSSALFDSDVTTAMQLGAAAGFAAPFDSTNHVLIERATCTVAPSTATSPTVGDGVGTAFIQRPWVSGVPTFVS